MSIYLRALEPEDFEITHGWRIRESDWQLLVGMKKFISKDTERRWVLSEIKKHERGETLRFAICNRKTHALVGMISTFNIDHRNRVFEIASVIGDVQLRGRGVATRAGIKVMSYMFNELGMNKAMSKVLESNSLSIRFVEKAGFVKEGVLRKAVYKDGKYKDLFVYGMLKDDFFIRLREFRSS